MSEFVREERYIVFKINKMTNYQRRMIEALRTPSTTVECIVVESDWPEYEPTWESIEKRCTSNA